MDVFDGKFMQAEFFLDLQQQHIVRLVQSQPHERVGLFEDVTDLVEADIAKALTIAVGEGSCTLIAQVPFRLCDGEQSGTTGSAFTLRAGLHVTGALDLEVDTQTWLRLIR